MNELFSIRILAIFILLPTCQVNALCQLDKVKKDIFFLLDSSGSVGFRNFRTAKSFIAEFISRLPIGPNDTHVAVIRFSSAPKRYASLNSYYSKPNLIAAVSNILYNGGTTNTAEALQYSRKKLMKKYRGDRNDVENIIIIITDGSSTSHPAKLKREVAILHRMQVTIVAIGVGAMVNKTELDAMASEERFSFSVDNYKALFEIQASLFGVACQAEKTLPDVTTKQETTGEFTLHTTVESQTISTSVSSFYARNRHSTSKFTTSKASLQTMPIVFSQASGIKTSHQPTTTSPLTKLNNITVPFTNRVGNITEKNIRLLTTVAFRKHPLENSSVTSLLSNSRQTIQRHINLNTQSVFKGSTEISPTNKNESDVPGTQNELDTHKPQKDLDDKNSRRKSGNYFVSKSQNGFSKKVQNDFNIILYITVGFAVAVVISGIVIIATRKSRFGEKRRKRGLETV